MFWLTYVMVNIQNILLWLECRHTPLVNAIVNNALFHSNSYINQMLPQIIHILYFFSHKTCCPRFCNDMY